jgi:hypothetical protein
MDECTLDAADLSARLAAWAAVAASATCTDVDGGVRLTFEEVPAGLADLVAAERTCCSFLGFDLTADALTITADDAAAVRVLLSRGRGGGGRPASG